MVHKSNKSRGMNVYANLTRHRRTKKEADARKKAEYLASLPKHPLKRLLYRLHPKRVAGYWFSKKGAMMALKIVGVFILLVVLAFGALFAYYRKDLDAIRPGELAKRVQTTVTKYYDRNGAPLWEDKGDGDYKLVVDGKDISETMKEATIAIEDKDFYKHSGVSVSGIFRSLLNNAQGGSTQGGSTLTQQLVKQVFFADEAQKRGLDGIPRKIKEIILAIEVERMYNKEQILNLYLNESPYGGRRNGVESAAKTYFEKSSKDLTLAESALLAAIPNQPGLYNPYEPTGHEALVARQHKTLDSMVEMGYITKAQADEAKAFPILDSIKPAIGQFDDIKAPHFVQLVKKQLAQELGEATVGRGGLTITTTLDLRVQTKLEEAMNEMFDSGKDEASGFSNGAGTVEDNATGQIIAMLGSRNFHYPGYGQDNASIAFIQPGSSIKPLVYAELFAQKPSGQPNYGSGSILSDSPTTFPPNNYKPNNADGGFRGNINIRQSLALSRNIPAIKAMAAAGIQPTWELIRAAGDKQYCTQGADAQAGLSSAIGGCGTKQVDHVNAFATLARGGVYKPHSMIMEVKNSQGETLKKWKDESKQVIDPQIAYILSDILTDNNARRGLIGGITQGFTYGNTGIKTATKTGTSDIDRKPKDLWMMTYSPAVSMGVWLGNSDTRPLLAGNSTLPGPIVDKVMRFVHQEVYATDGRWKPNDWFTQPAGVQRINNELFPSWYDKNQSRANAKLMFDKISKKKATNCTPDAAKIEVDVNKSTDPVTKADVYVAPEGYDATKDDDVHKCEDTKPTVGTINVTKTSGMTYQISVSVVGGTHPLQQVEIKVGSTIVATLPATSSGTFDAAYTFTSTSAQTITATVSDSALYTNTGSKAFTPSSSSSGGG